MVPARAPPALQVSPVMLPSGTSLLHPPTLDLNTQRLSKPPPQPKSAPGRGCRHIVAWVPDSLAEKCYNCQTSFSLMLRRHHCRRCGNVFCDACSSARMPLVNSGFVTPVRVCAKCSVAAKKAHAQMVHERQTVRKPDLPRRHSDSANREGSTMEGVRVSVVDDPKHWHIPERRRRRSDRPLEYRGSLDVDTWMMEGGIITSNGRRNVAMSPVYARKGSSGNYERRESQETENSRGPRNRYLPTLPGEAVLVKNEHVRIKCLEQMERVGTLYVTNYRLVFSPRVNRLDLKARTTKDKKEGRVDERLPPCFESLVAYQAIPLRTIDRIKRKEMVETDCGVLEVLGKDFRRVTFAFDGLVSKQTFSKFDRTCTLVRMHALGDSEGKVDEFAKLSLERFDEIHGAIQGCCIYDAVEEFQRMGISSASTRWRLSYVNDRYELCPTYPSILAVPSSVSDSLLAVASKFRSKGRIPVLAWRDRHTGAVICRSSQPLVGLGQKQCDKDVFLIQAIAAANPSSSKLVIIDARPWKNAVAQKAVGRAGYELTEHYETRHATSSLKYVDMVASEHTAAAAAAISAGTTTPSCEQTAATNELPTTTDSNGLHDCRGHKQYLETKDSALVLTECKLIFMGIENIHTMRKSYQKLMDLCTIKQTNDKWLDQLASTHWLSHISRILDSAVEIVRIVKEQKSSVLIHCSDGWDRTAQLTALTEVLLDPYYRTIVGFEQLIEKEWCSFGHKFRDRTSHGASTTNNETSPVFLQWMDCVWQVMTQFPSAFEFNERFLILILDHLYSCRFGTFLYNSQRERKEQESLHPTHSLWSYLSTVEHAIVMNPFYKPHTASRLKWKASVTATRPCVERSCGDQSCEELSRVRTENDSDMDSMTDDFVHFQRNAFDASDWSWASRHTAVALSTTVASPDHLDGDATEADVDAALQSSHEQLSFDMHRVHLDPHDFYFNGNDVERCEHDCESKLRKLQPLSFHKLVRDLDTGLIFPQPLKISADITSPPKKPRSQEHDVSYRTATLSTPKVRSFTSSPAAERTSLSMDGLWNFSDVSESHDIGRYASCDDVIVPSCSMKSLTLWAHYYLRWDSSCTFYREASIEIETLHLDVLMRLKALTKQNREATALKKSRVQTNCHNNGRHFEGKVSKDSPSLQDSKLGLGRFYNQK